jgi:hypothetical protein
VSADVQLRGWLPASGAAVTAAGVHPRAPAATAVAPGAMCGPSVSDTAGAVLAQAAPATDRAPGVAAYREGAGGRSPVQQAPGAATETSEP